MDYIILNKNRYYAMLTKTNAVKKTNDIGKATRFLSEEMAQKVIKKASSKLKDYIVVTEEEALQPLEKLEENLFSENDSDSDEVKKTKRRSFTPAERAAVYNKACGCCTICGEFVPIDDFTIDHIMPISKGGSYDLDNLQLAHPSCNRMKDDALPDDFFDKMIKILEYQQKKNPKIRKKLKRRFGG